MSQDVPECMRSGGCAAHEVLRPLSNLKPLLARRGRGCSRNGVRTFDPYRAARRSDAGRGGFRRSFHSNKSGYQISLAAAHQKDLRPVHVRKPPHVVKHRAKVVRLGQNGHLIGSAVTFPAKHATTGKIKRERGKSKADQKLRVVPSKKCAVILPSTRERRHPRL